MILQNPQVCQNISWTDNMGKSASDYAELKEIKDILTQQLIRNRLRGTATFIKSFGMIITKEKKEKPVYIKPF